MPIYVAMKQPTLLPRNSFSCVMRILLSRSVAWDSSVQALPSNGFCEDKGKLTRNPGHGLD